MRNNSRFATNQSHNYVVVDFDNVTEKGLKKLITALKSAGALVVSVDASNKKMKRDKETVKKAKLNFENGQAMTLYIGDEGDIYQMTLNATKQPIPSVKNERELAKAMFTLMDRNQAKFDKAVARKAAAPVKDESTSKPASKTLATKIKEASAALAIATSNRDNAQAAVNKAQSELEAEQQKLAELESELAKEQQETKDLESQIEGQ